MMAGDLVGDEMNTPGADHLELQDGYVSISVHNIDSTDYNELYRLAKIDFGL